MTVSQKFSHTNSQLITQFQTFVDIQKVSESQIYIDERGSHIMNFQNLLENLNYLSIYTKLS